MKPLRDKPNTAAPTGIFPYGDIKDDLGENNGTPVNREVYGDIHQFVEELMVFGAVNPNGLPDNASNGFQIAQALKEYIRKILENDNANLQPDVFFPKGVRTNNTAILTDVYPIGACDMDADNIKFVEGIRQIIPENYISIDVLIRMDELADASPFWQNCYNSSGFQVMQGRYPTLSDPQKIRLTREESSGFNNTDFDRVDISRGWVVIKYIL